jgi:serine protease
MFKRVIVGTVAATACLLGSAAVAQAQPAAKAPPFKVINLHSAYEKALPKARAGKLSGIVYARGKQPAAAKHVKQLTKGKQNSCTEPNCPLVYNGGSVQHTPHVYLLLWGPNWSSDPNQTASANYLGDFYGGLGVQPQDTWSTITDQYGDGSGNPSFSGSVFEGTWQDTSTPPTGVDQNQLSAEAEAFASTEGITDIPNAQVVVATQSGTCPAGFYAPSCNGGSGNYCAWHTSSNITQVPFTNLPYVLDAGAGCGENSVQNQWDGFSIVGGHEYAETITDPFPVTGWWDSADASGGEIGDKCAWQNLNTVTLSTGAFAVQPLYSNNAFNNTGTGCVLSAPQQDTVTVTNPGNQTNAAGTPLSLQVQGQSSGGLTLTWGATGLPTGLSIDSSSGLISGTPTQTGSYNVTVTATDTSSASGSASFTWVITKGGPITGYGSKCLDDWRDGDQNRNKIDIWTCNGTEAQAWTYAGNMLKIRGKCLDDKGYGGPGTALVLYTCNGQQNQMWTYNGSGEYVGYHHLCLTDPGSSTTNGTQVTIDVCQGTANQMWSLPVLRPHAAHMAPHRPAAKRPAPGRH